VRELRPQRGVSPEDLADALGLRVLTPSLIGRRFHNPDYLLRARISDLFGVPITEVFWVEEPPSPPPERP
jgi:transcriptional regulator with XRE-family HTH domain